MMLRALGLALLLVFSIQTAAVAAPQPGVRASYAAAIRGTDNHIDAAATIARLQAMNANTYAYLVLRDTDWGDLQSAFAAAAQAAGITLWIYLVPPSECPPDTTCSGYLPYKKDYAAWGRAIATLAVQYPVVKAWAIDDFNANSGFFTPAYTGQIRAAARAISPTLDLYPVVYYTALTQSFVDSYGSVIDSVIFPYRDDPLRNTQWTGTLRAQLDTVSQRLATKGRKPILMVYATTLSNTVLPPDVAYVRTLTTIGMQYTAAGTIAGVIQYALPLTPGRPLGANQSHGSGLGALVFTVRADQATTAGSYAAAVATVRLNSGSTSCRMVLWHSDNRQTSSPIGYHIKQAIVGGTLVWQRDVASEETAWYTSAPLELAPYFSNGAAALTLRLWEKAGVSNYHVTVRFDDITLTGCSVSNPTFETAGGWTLSRGGNGGVLGSVYTYDPAYSTTVLNAVAQLYQ
ncbi:MAG TPA: hypothetical protein VFC19_18110 [Candidatus Limnocylindrales bacterium]|nr:hypothetical protein [Candidatus Limnocylindrales bacterium]